MRKFVLKLIFFIVPIIILAFLFDYFLTVNLKKSKSFAQGELSVWNDLYSGKINADIVIYGSSRAWVHIDPKKVADSFNLKVYNLGISGHNFWLQYLRHKTLLEYNKTPACIIFSLDVFTLKKRIDLYNSDQFLPYMFFNKDIKDYTATYRGFSFFDYYLPLYRYAGNVTAIKQAIKISLSGIGSLPGRKNGFHAQDKNWEDDFQNANEKIKSYEVKIDTPSMYLFDRFLTECKAKKIKLIFVYTPEYIEGQNLVRNRNEMINVFKNFSNRYNILFLNYSDDEMCRQRNYFYNASHLNKTGAEIFTNKLIRDLKNSNELNGIKK